MDVVASTFSAPPKSALSVEERAGEGDWLSSQFLLGLLWEGEATVAENEERLRHANQAAFEEEATLGYTPKVARFHFRTDTCL